MRAHYFAYTSLVKPGKFAEYFRVRDGSSFLELYAGIQASRPIAFGETLVQYPAEGERPKSKDFPLLELFEPGDLLICPTRPPLTDIEAKSMRWETHRRQSHHSGTQLEKILFEAFRSIFPYCTRRELQVHKKYELAFRGHRINRFMFDVNNDAWLDKLYMDKTKVHAFARGENSTVGVFFRTPPIPKINGAQVIFSFGFSGTDTLAFNRFLRSSRNGLLDTTDPVLSLVWIKYPRDDYFIPDFPSYIQPDNEWNVDTILSVSP